MSRPNFFLLGAAKSGTTTLHRCLNRHPSIYLSSIKEPNFYYSQYQVVDNLADYLALFNGVDKEVIVGESSHAYFSDPNGAQTLKQHYPNAKFLVILRNPAKRAYSLFNHMLRHGYEHASTFEKALALESSRIASASFIEHCNENIWNFSYFKSGLYGEQVERYFSLFDKKQFHFLTLENLYADEEKSLSNILHFLDLDSDAVPKLSVENSINRIPYIPILRFSLRKHFSSLHNSTLIRSINRLNSKSVPPMIDKTYDNLMTLYQEDQEKLYLLTGIKYQN